MLINPFLCFVILRVFFLNLGLWGLVLLELLWVCVHWVVWVGHSPASGVLGDAFHSHWGSPLKL